jgi:YgiT-type zinc finger domain-containing protein
MTCEFCNGQTVKRKVNKLHRLDGRLYMVENVQADVCRECGERYYHAKTLDTVDVLLRGKHQVRDKIEVEVVAL